MPELPTTFGKYYLTEKLATGGMAEIYLAKLIGPGGFEKALVIKQIHPRLSGQRHFVDLFVAEAKTLVTLAHGNIVPVYELGVVDDTYFIAMEYIDGPTLYRLTESMAGREARMEPPVAAWIAARILDGLDYAHRKGEGVIHRDLSPRNVMLSRDGEVKLVDFGIAVTLGESETAAAASAPTGSFPYMSPEQVRREALTGQTDLFSVGVLFWEMLVGDRLFARSDPEATLDAVLRADIPLPSRRRAEVPTRLDEVLMRALQRDRDARWPSAGEMLAALNKYLYGLEHTPGPREIGALVARYCPPETRRLPTHVEAGGGEADAGAAGPHTAVIPRDQDPRGKRPRRAQTFATHVALEGMLAQAQPPEPTAAAPESASSRRGAIAPPLGVPGRNAPSRGALVLAGLGALGLGVAAVYVFYRGRAAVLRDDAAVAIAVTDARAPDAPRAPPDVAPERSDAAVTEPRDAALAIVRPRIDAGGARGAIDAGAAAPATATLRLGADPWGEIYIDGTPYGHTPQQIAVGAGHHNVEIVFPAETPPRKQTFAVDLAPAETKVLQAEFR
jgi:serine/threonine-protein kinase